MPIDLFWDDDNQTVMLAEFSGKWTWDELHAMLGTIKRLSTERGQIFGAIIDVRNGLELPGGNIFNRDGLAQFRKMLTLNDDEGKGPVVILGMNKMVKAVFDAVGQFDKSLTNDVTFANTMDDARRTIYSAVNRINQQQTSA